MSSVQDIGDCPRCAGMGAYLFDCHSNEVWFNCFYCGYSRETINLIDRKRSNKKKRYYKLNKKGGVIQRTSIRKPYGAYVITRKKGISQLGVLNEDPLDETGISWFREILENPDIDADQSYITRWDEESKKVIFLVGNPEIALRIYREDKGASDAEPIKNPEVPDHVKKE